MYICTRLWKTPLTVTSSRNHGTLRNISRSEATLRYHVPACNSAWFRETSEKRSENGGSERHSSWCHGNCYIAAINGEHWSQRLEFHGRVWNSSDRMVNERNHFWCVSLTWSMSSLKHYPKKGQASNKNSERDRPRDCSHRPISTYPKPLAERL